MRSPEGEGCARELIGRSGQGRNLLATCRLAQSADSCSCLSVCLIFCLSVYITIYQSCLSVNVSARLFVIGCRNYCFVFSAIRICSCICVCSCVSALGSARLRAFFIWHGRVRLRHCAQANKPKSLETESLFLCNARRRSLNMHERRIWRGSA